MTGQEQAIEDKLIDPEYHQQLLADIPGVVRQAGIPEKYVWASIHNYCSNPTEVEYVARLKTEECPLGMYYLGEYHSKGTTTIIERMMAITGACLRNYINAKVMTLYDIFGHLKEGTMPSPTVLLIPDFSVGAKLTDWQKSSLLGLLYRQEQGGKKTIVYVRNMTELELEYGKAFVSHIQNNFVEVQEG